ncbi:MAG: hypothetical protein ACRDL7_13255, partial [Gaiellaceae bacterium]
PTPYMLYTWTVPVANGGSLSITTAPTSVVVGTTETIKASYSGASLSEWHLGVITHTSDDVANVNTQTVVSIDNR